MTANPLLDRILYRDRLVIVLDKPAGMPVHAGPSGVPCVEDFLADLAFEKPQPPGLAHRLDQDTSGCLALGRERRGLRRLGMLFQAGRADKEYWAVTQGAPTPGAGVIDLPLRKVSGGKGWRVIVDRMAGQRAVTAYRVLGTSPDGLAWIACRPRTGRTHQIRVHLAAAGAPLVGDPQYGVGYPGGPPMHLHARALTLPLYDAKPPVRAEAPVPPHMRAALAACGWTGAP